MPPKKREKVWWYTRDNDSWKFRWRWFLGACNMDNLSVLFWGIINKLYLCKFRDSSCHSSSLWYYHVTPPWHQHLSLWWCKHSWVHIMIFLILIKMHSRTQLQCQVKNLHCIFLMQHSSLVYRLSVVSSADSCDLSVIRFPQKVCNKDFDCAKECANNWTAIMWRMVQRARVICLISASWRGIQSRRKWKLWCMGISRSTAEMH